MYKAGQEIKVTYVSGISKTGIINVVKPDRLTVMSGCKCYTVELNDNVKIEVV